MIYVKSLLLRAVFPSLVKMHQCANKDLTQLCMVTHFGVFGVCQWACYLG